MGREAFLAIVSLVLGAPTRQIPRGASDTDIYLSELPMTDVERVAEVLRARYGHVQEHGAESEWPHASSRVIDCVLSLNRRYNAVVRPRVARFGEQHPNVESLMDLQDLVRNHGSPHRFCVEVLQYDDARRADTLVGVVSYLLDAQVEHAGASELERLARWATWCRPGDYLTVGVQGFGIAGFQYLRMLFGAQTAKPDVHIVAFVSSVLARTLSPVQALNMMERAARLVDLPLRAVDAAIWSARAAR